MGNREMTIFRAILAIACLAMTGPVTAQTPEKNKSPYPIVINDLKVLRPAGLTLTQRGEFKDNFPHLKHRCYSYGDGGYLISVDDDFLRRHEARGFTLNSLCMALISGIRFDPESPLHVDRGTAAVAHQALATSEAASVGSPKPPRHHAKARCPRKPTVRL